MDSINTCVADHEVIHLRYSRSAWRCLVRQAQAILHSVPNIAFLNHLCMKSQEENTKDQFTLELNSEKDCDLDM